MTAGLQDLLEQKVSLLPMGLQQHISRVVSVAEHLSRHHGIDEEKTKLGALAHDLARAMKGEDLLKMAKKLKVPVHAVEEQVPILLHGPVAAELLRQQEGLDDDTIHEAVYWHSTAHPGLDASGKVVFLSDKLDPKKIDRYPYLPQLAELAELSLDRAVLDFLGRELTALFQQGSLVHPVSVETRNHLLMTVGGESP